ncbi:MAG: CD225/dispanin family protein [Bacteroidaceae bacterium]|nr:CD225/dispanin family protein [Bacteroidaceae bacterium]
MEESNNLKRPGNNLVWAILTTIFCCMPFGIVALIYAAQVDSQWAQGLHEQAIRSAKEAKKWSIIAAVSAAVIWVIQILLLILCIAGGLALPFIFNELQYSV